MRVCILAVNSLVSVESSACVKSLEITDIRFILLVPLCDCKSAAPFPKFETSHMA